MANFHPNFTPRIVIKYDIDGERHSATIRAVRDVVLDQTMALDYVGRWQGFWVAVIGQLSSSGVEPGATIEEALFAQQDSDIFIPISGAAGLVLSVEDNSTRGASAIDKALLYSVTGRAESGKKIVLYFWGIRRTDLETNVVYEDWRWDGGEIPAIVAEIGNKLQPTSVNELGEVLAAPDGSPLAFTRPRMNVRPGAKAINRARSR